MLFKYFGFGVAYALAAIAFKYFIGLDFTESILKTALFFLMIIYGLLVINYIKNKSIARAEVRGYFEKFKNKT